MIGLNQQNCERCGKKILGLEIKSISIQDENEDGFTYFLCEEHLNELMTMIKDYTKEVNE